MGANDTQQRLGPRATRASQTANHTCAGQLKCQIGHTWVQPNKCANKHKQIKQDKPQESKCIGSTSPYPTWYGGTRSGRVTQATNHLHEEPGNQSSGNQRQGKQRSCGYTGRLTRKGRRVRGRESQRAHSPQTNVWQGGQSKHNLGKGAAQGENMNRDSVHPRAPPLAQRLAAQQGPPTESRAPTPTFMAKLDKPGD